MLIAAVTALALIVLIRFFRQQSWAAALWVLLVAASLAFAFVMTLAVIAGSYALLIVPACAPFAMVFVGCVFVRPRREAFTRRALVYGLVFSGLVTGCFALPRPDAYRVHVLVLAPDHQPAANASISWTAFHGLGANFDGQGLTDATGRYTFTTYWPEDGEFIVRTPSAEVRYRYGHWPESMAGGRRQGIRFVAEGDKQRLENNQYVIGRVIAANTEEVLEVHLLSK
jgi:hypothetical protein